MENHKKPPLGVYPKWIMAEKRVVDLKAAINRYLDAYLIPDLEWYKEMYELSLYLVNREIEKLNKKS